MLIVNQSIGLIIFQEGALAADQLIQRIENSLKVKQ